MKHPHHLPAADSSLELLPLEATLSLPQDVQYPYLILKLQSSSDETARIPIHPSSCITATTNSSTSPQALFIGRQVTSCDIRIDHGSISRKHAVFYFIPNPNPTNHTSPRYHLIVQDLGTKHGITINHVRIPAQEPTVLYQEDEIQFGKVYEQVFVVSGWISRISLEQDTPAVVQPVLQTATANIQKEGNPQNQHSEQESTAIHTRAQREAEIQAMIESLEQTPLYAKLNSLPSHDDDHYGSDNQDELDTDKKRIIQPPPHSSHSSFSSSTTQSLHQLSSLFMKDPQTSFVINKYQLPISCTWNLPRNPTSSSSSLSDCITALHSDSTGARLLTGTSHGFIHLYDFSGMTLSNPYPFKSVLMEEGQYPIHDAAYSIRSGGDRIFVGTGSPQPTLLDREGKAMIQCSKGDPYVTDTAKNAGHTGSVTSVAWHPLGDASNTTCCNIVLSSSGDSSVRIWDVEKNKVIFDKLTSRGEDVLRVKNEKGQRIVMGGGGVTCATFSPNGREIALGTACGSIQIWKYGGPYTRPIRAVYHAHGGKKNPTSLLSTTTSTTSPAIHSLVYSPNGTYLASRSMDDDTVRVWTAQSLSNSSVPCHICVGNLVCLNEFTNCAFRPDGNMLCAGTSAPRSRNESEEQASRRPDSYSRLKFYSLEKENVSRRLGGIPERSNLYSKDSSSTNVESLYRYPVLDVPIVEGVSIGKVLWHPKLNQIFLGLSDGSVQILFDPTLSAKGALLCAAKGLRVKDDLSVLLEKRAQASHDVQGEIIAPNDPSFREQMMKRKRERAERKDPIKSKHPEPPAVGIKASEGSGGVLNLVQYIATGSAPTRKIAMKDPREDLFKYVEGKNYVESSVYDGDRKVLAEKTVEEEEEDERKRSKI